jgi:hypothetical protein
VVTVGRRAAMAGPREAGRERRTGEEGGAGPARLVGTSHEERKGEGRHTGGPRARARAYVWLGRARGRRRDTTRVQVLFFFLKNVK